MLKLIETARTSAHSVKPNSSLRAVGPAILMGSIATMTGLPAKPCLSQHAAMRSNDLGVDALASALTDCRKGTPRGDICIACENTCQSADADQHPAPYALRARISTQTITTARTAIRGK
jgi:hypothetical protein